MKADSFKRWNCKYESVGNPELDSWTIEALPVTPTLLDLAIPRMVLYMLYLYNCVCVELLHHYFNKLNLAQRGAVHQNMLPSPLSSRMCGLVTLPPGTVNEVVYVWEEGVGPV